VTLPCQPQSPERGVSRKVWLDALTPAQMAVPSFKTQAEAQRSGAQTTMKRTHNLDSDGDSKACEKLS